MADDLLTIADLARINDQNIVDAGASEILNKSPLLAALAARKSSHGTVHKYVKKTAAPVVGFRAPNSGVDRDHTERSTVSIDLEAIDATSEVDVLVADIYPDGPDACVGMEVIEHIASGLFTVEKQIWYGSASGGLGLESGFAGLLDSDLYKYKDSEMVIDAEGTTANTGSSVWLIRSTPDHKNCSLVLGTDDQEATFRVLDTSIQQVLDSESKKYMAHVTPVHGWVGCQFGTKYSAVRICNLTAEAGKGLTDELIYEAVSKFPSNEGPTHAVMSRRSKEQLRKSRTATNATGQPAPTPMFVGDDIPVITTDSILNTEPLAIATP